MQSTPLGIRRSKDTTSPTTPSSEDQGDMYVELELSRGIQQEGDEKTNCDRKSEHSCINDGTNNGLLDANHVNMKTSESTLSQYEREMKDVIEELRARQLSDDEDIKL